jgi:hypothetical protein
MLTHVSDVKILSAYLNDTICVFFFFFCFTRYLKLWRRIGRRGVPNEGTVDKISFNAVKRQAQFEELSFQSCPWNEGMLEVPMLSIAAAAHPVGWPSTQTWSKTSSPSHTIWKTRNRVVKKSVDSLSTISTENLKRNIPTNVEEQIVTKRL